MKNSYFYGASKLGIKHKQGGISAVIIDRRKIIMNNVDNNAIIIY